MRRIICLIVSIITVSFTGCATHEGTGAAIGGALGAGTGTLIGAASGHAGAGALIGGGIGALGGALVGREEDKAERREMVRQASASSSGPMSTGDVLYMTSQGVSEDNIIAQIRNTRTRFVLTTDDLVNLKNQGVSPRVMQVMQESQRLPAQRIIVREPPPVVYVEPYPPPPVSIGFGYHHYHRRGW